MPRWARTPSSSAAHRTLASPAAAGAASPMVTRKRAMAPAAAGSSPGGARRSSGSRASSRSRSALRDSCPRGRDPRTTSSLPASHLSLACAASGDPGAAHVSTTPRTSALAPRGSPLSSSSLAFSSPIRRSTSSRSSFGRTSPTPLTGASDSGRGAFAISAAASSSPPRARREREGVERLPLHREVGVPRGQRLHDGRVHQLLARRLPHPPREPRIGRRDSPQRLLLLYVERSYVRGPVVLPLGQRHHRRRRRSPATPRPAHQRDRHDGPESRPYRRARAHQIPITFTMSRLSRCPSNSA